MPASYPSALLPGYPPIFDWWLRQIASLAPWLRMRTPEAPDATIIDIKDITSILSGNIFARKHGVETLVAPLDPSFQRPQRDAFSLVGLRLPPEMSLRRDAVFPIQVKAHVHTAIDSEMDRLTPFTASEVFWSIHERKRDPRKLKLTLLIVPKSPIEALLATLAKMQLSPSFIETGGGRIQLSGRIGARANVAHRAMLSLCTIFLAAIVSVPVIFQQRHLDSVENQLQNLAPAQRELVALHRQINNFNSGLAIQAAARKNGDELQILSTLTKALPNGTWLNQLTLAPGNIVIAGESGNAAQLISALATSPGLGNPSFTAPVTRPAGSDTDLFSIQLANQN